MNALSHFRYIIDTIVSSTKSKIKSTQSYLSEIKSDIRYYRERFKKNKEILKTKIPNEIESFKRTTNHMNNIIFAFLAYSLLIITISFITNTYNSNFINNFLVNANSSILDFLILGVILYYFEHKRQNKELTRDLIEDLENLAKHSSAELNIMKIKIIRQLNSKGIFNIQIPRIELTNLSVIKYLTFKDADLTGLNMSESYVRDCTFENCSIQGLNIKKNKIKNVKFINCMLKNINAENTNFHNVLFENCVLDGGLFIDSNLKSCILKKCDFKSVTYQGANMRNANILDAINIDIDKITEAQCLDYLICDEQLKDNLIVRGGNIKFSRGKIRG